jgi:hypothetical protein
VHKSLAIEDFNERWDDLPQFSRPLMAQHPVSGSRLPSARGRGLRVGWGIDWGMEIQQCWKDFSFQSARPNFESPSLRQPPDHPIDGALSTRGVRPRMRRPPRLQRCHGTYTFRCRLPIDIASRLGRREFVPSLKTTCYCTARRRHVALMAAFAEVVALTRTRENMDKTKIEALFCDTRRASSPGRRFPLMVGHL